MVFLWQVVYLESETGPDLVVLSSRWLCVDIIGSLMSHEKISQARITGCFSMDEFQLMFPEIEAANLLHVRSFALFLMVLKLYSVVLTSHVTTYFRQGHPTYGLFFDCRVDKIL